jgi:putative oxidoreductase
MMTTQSQPWPIPSTNPVSTRSRLTTVALWALQLVAAGMFLMAGTMKLSGNPMMVDMFATIGVGQWFRYVTGGIEVVGAILVLVPSMARYGALALAAAMVGAILTHLFIIGGSPAMPIVLLAMVATIAWARWGVR